MSYGNNKKSIEVTIDETGGVEIEAHGFTDGSCRSATEALEKAMGVVQNREMKNNTPTRTDREKVTSG